MVTEVRARELVFASLFALFAGGVAAAALAEWSDLDLVAQIPVMVTGGISIAIVVYVADARGSLRHKPFGDSSSWQPVRMAAFPAVLDHSPAPHFVDRFPARR